MSYRYRSYTPAPAQLQPPSALRIMTVLLVAFVVVSLMILLAGRLPFPPTPLANGSSTYRQYVANDTQLLTTYGKTAEGAVHIPIDQAMKLIVERGLPVRNNPSATP